MEKVNVALIVVVVLLVVAVGTSMYFMRGSDSYGGEPMLQPYTPPSRVQVTDYYQVSASAGLDGIDFPTITLDTVLPWVDEGAVLNGDVFSPTGYFITVDESSVVLELCVESSRILHDDDQGIDFGNGYLSDETYSFSLNNQYPDVDDAVPFVLNSPFELTDFFQDGDVASFRFWLDAPLGVASGDYTNVITFRITEEDPGSACGV